MKLSKVQGIVLTIYLEYCVLIWLPYNQKADLEKNEGWWAYLN